MGVELYFDDLNRARDFCAQTLGLKLAGEQEGHHAQFGGGDEPFLCLEKKGVESYPSQAKAVVFFEVADLKAALLAIGGDQVVERHEKWAVLHDPGGHNVLLLQR